MLSREEIIKILKQAESIDKQYKVFGASKHKYKLNNPIRKDYVEMIEEKYNFKLPEEYFKFITEVGDGGAGPDYGIKPFSKLMVTPESVYNKKAYEDYIKEYVKTLSQPFDVRNMKLEEVEEFAITTVEGYKEAPDRFFANIENDDVDTKGYLVLGTHGCQWDFGIITCGERFGQIFDTDNEGGFAFVENNFDDYYSNWLKDISDIEKLTYEINFWNKVLT